MSKTIYVESASPILFKVQVVKGLNDCGKTWGVRAMEARCDDDCDSSEEFDNVVFVAVVRGGAKAKKVAQRLADRLNTSWQSCRLSKDLSDLGIVFDKDPNFG